jgi:hypothetical protein
MTYILKNTKLYLIIFIFLFLSSCKIDFVGDIYTSDLISIAEKGGSINLPMEISFQVTSCDDDNSSLNKKIGSYFVDYKQIDCGTGDDFMSYIKSKVSVPITNNQKEFETQNKSLVGYVSTLNEEEKKTEVYLVVNLQKLENLSDYVENETFQKLSLVDSKFKINLNNDIDNLKVAIYPSIVDGVPIVYPTFFNLNKREKITIENSNVSSMHLEIEGWTPLFYFNNN